MGDYAWLQWMKPPGWADLRNWNGNTPIAPISSQQTAGRLELSVQEMVGDIGGYKIEELCEAVKDPWAFKFRIDKVWRASDSLRETGVYSYLDHHWLILRLAPVDASRSNDRCWQPRGDRQGELPPPGEVQLARPAAEDAAGTKATPSIEPPQSTGAERNTDTLLGGTKRPEQPPASELSEPDWKRSRSGCSSMTHSPRGVEHPGEQDSGWVDCAQDADCAKDSTGETEGSYDRCVGDSTIRSSVSGEAKLQPRSDAGIDSANANRVWFLRIDRFDEADKWFACASFENALLTEQAREKHYRPTSEAILEVNSSARPLYLDCLTPSLLRLASVKYSVFAKGTHCQWHARVVGCLTASIGHFLDPGCISAEYADKVSRILTDGDEQAQYSIVAKHLLEPDGSAATFTRKRPEAPFLKACVQDVKLLAARTPHRFAPGLAHTPFPDVQFVYAALNAKA